MKTTKPLTDLKRELTELFKHDISNEDLIELKDLLSQYFVRIIDEEFDHLEKNRFLTHEDYENWLNEHLRKKSE
jgi:hypothetical protein